MKIHKKHKKQKEMRIDRILGTWQVIIGVIIIENIFFFLLVNYLLNVILSLPQIAGDLDNPLKYIGWENIFPNLDRLQAFAGAYRLIYIVLLFMFIYIDVRQAFKMRTSFSSRGFNMGQKGTERWTTQEEIIAQYKEVPDRDIAFQGVGGTIVSRIGDKLYIDDSAVNNLIIGITRSGKDEMYVVPSIDVYSRAEKQASMIIMDPKLEAYKSSKKTLEDRGYDVYLLNLDDPLHSMGFSPLEQIITLYLEGDHSNAELLAQAYSYSIFNLEKPIGGDSFWKDTASSLLTALILAHIEDCTKQDEIDNAKRKKEWEEQKKSNPELPAFAKKSEHIRKINMYSILNLFTELVRIKDQETDISALDMYFDKRPPLNRAKLKYAGIEMAGWRTKSNVFASMFAKLTIFTYENVAKMTAESTIRLEDIGFGDIPVAVFLGIPDYDKSLHFLATVFIRQAYFVLAKRATREMRGRCPRLVKFICNEFGNIPAVENMANIITVCLGRNISFDIFIQSYSQLEKLYEHDAETIKENCGNQIYILTNSKNTAEEFSTLIGNETIIDLERSGERLSTKKHIMENTTEKPLLNPNQLMNLLPGECVVKRVMKRTDRQGRRVHPTPIFNSEDSGKRFLFRYEYLQGTFPDPKTIELEKINTEDRSHIILKDIVWDYNMTFAQFKQMERRAAPLKEQKNLKQTKELLLSDIENKEHIKAVLQNVAGIKDVTDDMSVAEVYTLLEKADIKPEDKNVILSLFSIGLETKKEG